MKKSRFTEGKIIGVTKQMEAGRKAAELARELGVSEATIYTWKSRYGGLEVSEAKRLRELERENGELKKLVADLSLDKEALKTLIRKKRMELVGVRRDVALVMSKHKLSERRACKLVAMDRGVLLERRGCQMNHKRLYRLYRLEHLMVPRLKRNRLMREAPAIVYLQRANQE